MRLGSWNGAAYHEAWSTARQAVALRGSGSQASLGWLTLPTRLCVLIGNNAAACRHRLRLRAPLRLGALSVLCWHALTSG
jgi:hypothetical protein